MTSGTYAGLTIFQDRSSAVGATLSGGSNINLTGTYYFPSAPLTMSGSSSVAALGSQVICKTLAFSGSAGVGVTYNASSVARKATIAIVQ